MQIAVLFRPRARGSLDQLGVGLVMPTTVPAHVPFRRRAGDAVDHMERTAPFNSAETSLECRLLALIGF